MEILQKRSAKIILIILLITVLGVCGYFLNRIIIQYKLEQTLIPENHVISYGITYEDRKALSGKWRIAEFMDESIPELWLEALKSDDEKNESIERTKSVKKKFLNTVFALERDNLTYFSVFSEGGPYISWDELSAFRTPLIIQKYVPEPVLCVIFNLKDFEENFYIMMNPENNNTILLVKGQFFRLEKIE